MRHALIPILLLGIVLAIMNVLRISLNVCLLAFGGVLFAVFLNALSRWLRKWLPISYGWSLVIVIVTLVLGSAGGCFLLGRQIAQQLADLGPQLQDSGQQAFEQLRSHRWTQSYLEELPNFESLFGAGSSIATTVLQGLNGLMWIITGTLVIFFVGVYVALDPELYAHGLAKLAPANSQQDVDGTLHRLRSELGRWIVGRLISMSLVGVATSIGLWLLGVPLPLALGVLAALLSFVPNLGPILAAIPQALLALQVGESTVVYVLIFNILLQSVESYVVTPLIQKIEVSLPPALTIFAQLLLGVTLGILGVIMAAPITVVVCVLLASYGIKNKGAESCHRARNPTNAPGTTEQRGGVRRHC